MSDKQTVIPSNASGARSGPSRTLLIAGALQVGALFTPAVAVPLMSGIPFLRLPKAGPALIVLAVLAVAVSLRPRGWWRWFPSVLTGIIVSVAYVRILRSPSATFADFLVRRIVHPDWGFMPMSAAVVLGLIGAALVRRRDGQPSYSSNDTPIHPQP